MFISTDDTVKVKAAVMRSALIRANQASQQLRECASAAPRVSSPPFPGGFFYLCKHKKNAQK